MASHLLGTEFIPYSEALAMKELGFEEKCSGRYNGDEFQLMGWDRHGFMGMIYKTDVLRTKVGIIKAGTPVIIAAPLWQQAFRWFREKEIYSDINTHCSQHNNSVGYDFWIWDKKTGYEFDSTPDNKPVGEYTYKSLEEAQLACLQQLIKLVKDEIHTN